MINRKNTYIHTYISIFIKHKHAIYTNINIQTSYEYFKAVARHRFEDISIGYRGGLRYTNNISKPQSQQPISRLVQTAAGMFRQVHCFFGFGKVLQKAALKHLRLEENLKQKYLFSGAMLVFGGGTCSVSIVALYHGNWEGKGKQIQLCKASTKETIQLCNLGCVIML